MMTEEEQAKAQEQGEVMAKGLLGEVQSVHVLVDGEEHVASYRDDSVLFEKDGKVWGVMRDRIKMRKATADKKGVILAWEANGEIKSVELRPVPQGEWTWAIGMICGILAI